MGDNVFGMSTLQTRSAHSHYVLGFCATLGPFVSCAHRLYQPPSAVWKHRLHNKLHCPIYPLAWSHTHRWNFHRNCDANFVERCVSRFGCQLILTTDGGFKFEPSLFRDIIELLGIHQIRSMAYHPQADDMVERSHGQLKADLCAQFRADWTGVLHLAMLGIRYNNTADILGDPASLIFDCSMRIQAYFIFWNSKAKCVIFNFVFSVIRI